MSELCLIEQIYVAIRDAEYPRASNREWKVSRVLVRPEVWTELANDTQMRKIQFVPAWYDHGRLPITTFEIRGVPVIADQRAEPGFTLEMARNYRFRA